VRTAARWAVRAAAWAILLYLSHAAGAQGIDRAAVGEYQVKAAFLYHFAKFIEWPAAAGKGDVVVIGVLGVDPFGPALDFLFEDKTLRGKPFEVRRVASVTEARSCHLLFVSIADKNEVQRALAALAGSPVLTVGDSMDFVAGGGIIYLFVEESRIRFDINLAAARRSRLAISAALLRLARSVEGK
jgi:hypothetical protein